MVITQTQFNSAMTEINDTFKELIDRIAALEKRVEEKPTTTKAKK